MSDSLKGLFGVLLIACGGVTAALANNAYTLGITKEPWQAGALAGVGTLMLFAGSLLVRLGYDDRIDEDYYEPEWPWEETGILIPPEMKDKIFSKRFDNDKS